MQEHLLRFDKKKSLVFIDLETLNLCLNFQHNLPWQCAMIVVQGDNIVKDASGKLGTADFLIKWDTKLKISDDAARITRYSQAEMDNKGVSPEKVFPIVEKWLNKADLIVGHNILGFDLPLIKEWFTLNKKCCKHLYPKIIDTNLLAKGIKLNMPYKDGENLQEYNYRMYDKKAKGIKTRLEVLGKEYKIEHDYFNLHNAQVDLELNLKVWNIIKWRVEI